MPSRHESQLVRETNPLPSDYQHVPRSRYVPWDHPELTITRLRLVSDPGFPLWDVSYCHGRMDDGEEVRVQLPFDQLPKRGLFKVLYGEARKTGRYIRGLQGAVSTLN
jgi:hypothetical protein